MIAEYSHNQVIALCQIFAQLTNQEESWGLLENMNDIALWQGWQQELYQFTKV